MGVVGARLCSMDKRVGRSLKCIFYNGRIVESRYAHNPYKSEARAGPRAGKSLYFLQFLAYSLDFTTELIYNKA